MTTTDGQIVEDLKQMISRLEKERDTEIEAVQGRFQKRIDAFRRTLTVMCGGKLPLPEADMAPAMTSLSVGEDKIEWVREYLAHEGTARQADIAAALAEQYQISPGSASGATSVALRRLAIEGFAHSGPKIYGSTRWELAKVPAGQMS